MDLENRIVERITNHPSIDTSPSYSPDGNFICFNSDRSGYQQIYVMKKDGSNVKRISFGKGLYGTPVWSPRGDLIAFTKNFQGQYFIGVMRVDGSGERLLTENWYQEAPSWSSNGRVLIFYRETRTDDEGRSVQVRVPLCTLSAPSSVSVPPAEGSPKTKRGSRRHASVHKRPFVGPRPPARLTASGCRRR